MYVAKFGTIVVCLVKIGKGNALLKEGTYTVVSAVSNKYLPFVNPFALDSGSGVRSDTSDSLGDRHDSSHRVAGVDYPEDKDELFVCSCAHRRTIVLSYEKPGHNTNLMWYPIT